MRQEPERNISCHRDRHEILLDVVARAPLKLQRRRRRGECDVVKQESVTIGRRFRDLICPDCTAGAADVLDQYRLAETFGHALGKQPRQHVRGGPRRERHDDANGATWRPGLRQCRPAEKCRCTDHGCTCQQAAA